MPISWDPLSYPTAVSPRLQNKSHPSDPVPSSLTLLCVSSELSGACERPLENTLRSAVLVTLVSASERREPRADTESSQRAPGATPLCSGNGMNVTIRSSKFSIRPFVLRSLTLSIDCIFFKLSFWSFLLPLVYLITNISKGMTKQMKKKTCPCKIKRIKYLPQLLRILKQRN